MGHALPACSPVATVGCALPVVLVELCVTRLCFKNQEKTWHCEKPEFKSQNQNMVFSGRGFFNF